MPRIRIAETMGDLHRFAHTITPETTAGHAFLEYAHAKLTRFLEEIDRLTAERDFHTARKQEATQRRNEMLAEGSRLATAMRLTLKDHLGPDNERLAEFGIQPFRGRKRAKKPVDTETPPAETADNPQT
jgi:hypothetical protein